MGSLKNLQFGVKIDISEGDKELKDISNLFSFLFSYFISNALVPSEYQSKTAQGRC